MSEPRYPYLHVDAPPQSIELLSSRLFELGALGIEERDASTLLRSSAGEQVTTLVACFEDEASALAAQAELAPEISARLEHVVGDAWRDGWRAYFKPLRVGERLVVKPSWEAFEAGPNDLVITLDPGQAFGTGTHESTQLILCALPESTPRGARVLDVGTGSGILALGALRLGAAAAVAFDVDPLACRSARTNAHQNGLELSVFCGSSAALVERPAFELCVANMLLGELEPCLASVAARTRRALVASGYLRGEAPRVAKLLEGSGFELAREREEVQGGDCWAASVWLHARARQ